MWRSQRARESIITYRYELAPDTAWYLPMRLYLLWCDASIPNDICYAISVRFIFPTLTSTSHSLYLHIGGRKDSLFSQCWSFELWAFRTLGKHAPLSYNPRFPGQVWMFSTGDWTLHSPVHCPGKTENCNYFCCLPQGQLSQDCSLQAVGPLWWLKEFLTKRRNTDLTLPQTRPANLHVGFQYRNQFHHSQKPQLDNS